MSADRQQFTAAAVREKTAEANPHKATGQRMEQEPPKELMGGYGHQPLFALMRIILPTKGDLAIGKVYDPVIGDGNAMRVAGQILEDVFRTAEWRFRIDHPVLTEQRSEEGRKALCSASPFIRPGNVSFPA